MSEIEIFIKENLPKKFNKKEFYKQVRKAPASLKVRHANLLPSLRHRGIVVTIGAGYYRLA